MGTEASSHLRQRHLKSIPIFMNKPLLTHQQGTNEVNDKFFGRWNMSASSQKKRKIGKTTIKIAPNSLFCAVFVKK